MTERSFEYLKQFEEVMEIAYRSKYVRNIKKSKIKRLISIYNEIIGAKSGYNANNMCVNGKCLIDLILALRVEFIAHKASQSSVEASNLKDNIEIEQDTTKEIECLKQPKKGKRKDIENGKAEEGNCEAEQEAENV